MMPQFVRQMMWRGHQVAVASGELACVLTIMLGFTLDVTGALHVYGLGFLMGQKLAAGTALLLVAIALGWMLLGNTEPAVLRPSSFVRRPNLLIGLLLLAWLATMRNFLIFLAPGNNPLHLALAGAGVCFLGYPLVRPLKTTWLLIGVVLLGSAVRIASFAHVPIDPARDDMLPLVLHAIVRLLNGQTPYTIYQMPWELPLTYLPATWLAYLPAYLLGSDIRLTNLLAELVVGAGVFRLAIASPRNNEQPGEQPDEQPSEQPNVAVLLWTWFFLQPTALNWSLATTAPVQWAWLSLTLALVIARRHWLAALALGLTAAATPLAAIITPFMLLYWLRRQGWRHALLLAASAGVMTLVWVVPFLLWSPDMFLYGVWRWFNNNELYPALRWAMDHTWARQVGFSGIFWRHGLVGLLKPLQMALLIGVTVIYWHRGATAQQLAPLVVAAFLLFMVFNPVLWPYLYNPALIVALLAVTQPAPQIVAHPLPKTVKGNVYS